MGCHVGVDSLVGVQLSDWSDWGAGGYALAGSCVGCPKRWPLVSFVPLVAGRGGRGKLSLT